MTTQVESFYDELADRYHLVFEDWNSSIERQAAVLGPLLARQTGKETLRILDCACGIGTQSIGLAKLGHRVVASDVSKLAVDRARKEAKDRSVDITFYVSNMTSLKEVYETDFDVVVAVDNALPHLSPKELHAAGAAIASKLRPGGTLLASIRDYDMHWLQKPKALEPAFYGANGHRRIVHQVWDWLDEERYALHLYLTAQKEPVWETHHFVTEYRCLLRSELSLVLEKSGFPDVRWLMPNESGFYQPLVLARTPAGIP